MILVYLSMLSYAETATAELELNERLDSVEVSVGSLVSKSGISTSHYSAYRTSGNVRVVPVTDLKAVDYACLIMMGEAAVSSSWYHDMVLLPQVQGIRFEVIYGGFQRSELPESLKPKVFMKESTLVLRGHFWRGEEGTPDECVRGSIGNGESGMGRFDVEKTFEKEGTLVFKELTMDSILKNLKAEAFTLLQDMQDEVSKQSESVVKNLGVDPKDPTNDDPIDAFYDHGN